MGSSQRAANAATRRAKLAQSPMDKKEVKKLARGPCAKVAHPPAHARRLTVTSMEVVYALRRQGRTLYGHAL